LYADRQFQVDEFFPFIVFNQNQIRDCSSGGYLLTEKQNFEAVREKIMTVDASALQRLIDRGKNGEYVQLQDDAEKQCFELLSIIDHVAGRVQGSATRRKYQRNEIKSLIIVKGVPVFFITFAPVDFKHPICLYYCGEKIDLLTSHPSLGDAEHRLWLIARSPVACARFFHLMVKSFVVNILRADSGEDGLFGPTEAYYAPVE
ncbi:hypothetical protein BKA93DRAFT_693130, partial [Sparassis latifolia]